MHKHIILGIQSENVIVLPDLTHCMNINMKMLNSTSAPDGLDCGEELSIQDWEQIMDYRYGTENKLG